MVISIIWPPDLEALSGHFYPIVPHITQTDNILISMKILKILLLLFITLQAYASQEALVVRDKAVVYADIHLKHPIGFVGKWKRIRVGSVARNGGEALPVIVAGKIAYIKTDDLSIGRDSFSIANIAADYQEKDENKPLRDELEVGYDSFAGNINISDPTFGASAVTTSFTGFHALMNKFINTKFNWGYGVSYATSSGSDGVTINIPMAIADLTYKAFEWYSTKFNLRARGGFSPYTQLQTKYFDANGYAWSSSIAAQAQLPITRRFWVRGELGYNFTKVFGMQLPNGLGNFNPIISGPTMSLGMVFFL